MKKLIALFIALVMLATPFTFLASADGASPFAITKPEEEDEGETPGGDDPYYPVRPGNNDFINTAETVHSDFTITGQLDAEDNNDLCDYYRITAKNDSLMNFYVSFPEENDIDLWVMNESGGKLALSTSDSGSSELISGLNVTAGTTYYFMVIYIDGPTDCTYSLRVKEYPAVYTYYPQRPGIVDAGSDSDYYYPIGEMTNLYNYHYANSSELWERESWYWNLYQYGCVASSIAMVLSNLERSTQYAIPNILNASGSVIPVQIMEAHPYAILWANANDYPSYIGSSSQISINYLNSKYIANTTSGRDMAILRREQVAKLFDVTIYGYKIYGFSDEEKMNVISNLISENPEGICLSFIKYENGIQYPHTIVLTASTYNGTEEEYIPSKTSTANGSTYAPGVEPYSINVTTETTKGYIMEEYLYENYNERSITQLDHGNEFIVYDPIRDPNTNGGTTLSDCYTGRAYDWSHLYEIITIDINN